MQEYTLIHSEWLLKKYGIEKRKASIGWIDSGFKNSLLSTTDWPLKRIDAEKKQINPIGWLKEKSPYSKETPKKELPPPKKNIDP